MVTHNEAAGRAGASMEDEASPPERVVTLRLPKVLVGLSSFSGKSNANYFPRGASSWDACKKIEFVSSDLYSFEINSTFHVLPKASLVASWVKGVSTGRSGASHRKFVYSVKVPQFITHEKKFFGDECMQMWDALVRSVQPLYEAHALGAILFQLPPFAVRSTRILDCVIAMKERTPWRTWEDAKEVEDGSKGKKASSGADATDTQSGCGGGTVTNCTKKKRKGRKVRPQLPVAFVLDLRHASWYTEEVYSVLRKHKITLAAMRHPSLSFPDVVTAPVRYLRLHGPSLPLHATSYSTNELDELGATVKRWVESPPTEEDGDMAACERIFVFFCNDASCNAPEQAMRVQRAAGIRKPVEFRSALGAFLQPKGVVAS